MFLTNFLTFFSKTPFFLNFVIYPCSSWFFWLFESPVKTNSKIHNQRLESFNLYKKINWTLKKDELQKQNSLDNNIIKMQFLVMINFQLRACYYKSLWLFSKNSIYFYYFCFPGLCDSHDYGQCIDEEKIFLVIKLHTICF